MFILVIIIAMAGHSNEHVQKYAFNTYFQCNRAAEQISATRQYESEDTPGVIIGAFCQPPEGNKDSY